MKNKISISIIIIILLNLGLSSCSDKKPKRQLKIKKVKPRRGSIQIKVLASGTISPFHRIEVKSSEQGRVEKIFYKEGRYVPKGATLALLSTLDRVSLLDTARANLFKAKQKKDSAAIAVAEKNLKIVEKAYNPIPIIAPVSGEIIARNIQVGEHVAASQILFVVSDRLILKVNVDEADIGKIKKWQKVQFFVEAFPKEHHTGKVRQIAREGVEVSNVMQYEVLAFPNRVQKKWISGMSVNAEFYIFQKNDILLLPVDAVKTFMKKHFVVLEGPGGKTSLKPIKVGTSNRTDIEIVEGVDENDTIQVLTQKQFSAFMRRNRGKMRGMRRMMRGRRR